MIKNYKLFVSFIVTFLLIVTFYSVGCNPKELPVIKDKLKEMDDLRTEETEKAIENSPELKELDNLCKQIPLSEKFRFHSKKMSSHGLPALYLFYYSDDTFDESDKFFRKYFTENGWRIAENNSLNRISEFRKNDHMITIQYGGIGADANYAISCEKLSSQK